MSMRFGTEETCLVTEDAEFLVAQLGQDLLESGYEVICLDRLLSTSRDNIAHLSDHPSFQRQHHDVTDPAYPEADHSRDFTWQASPSSYQHRPDSARTSQQQSQLNIAFGLSKTSDYFERATAATVMPLFS